MADANMFMQKSTDGVELMRNTKIKIQGGFTLVELLVALMLFSILTTLAYRGVVTLSDAQEMLSQESLSLKALQRAKMIWKRDLASAAFDKNTAIIEIKNNGLIINNLPDHMSVVSGQPVSGIHYFFQDKKLYRQMLPSVSSLEAQSDVGNNAAEQIALLENLKSVNFSFTGINTGSPVFNGSGIQLGIGHELFNQLVWVVRVGSDGVDNRAESEVEFAGGLVDGSDGLSGASGEQEDVADTSGASGEQETDKTDSSDSSFTEDILDDINGVEGD